jgi:peptidoglycan/LPS O-acetylase OafA/YrhL
VYHKFAVTFADVDSAAALLETGERNAASTGDLKSSFEPTNAGPPRRNLDILRAVAVLLVFLSHLLQTHGLSSLYWMEGGDLGRAGVVLFFVHTSTVLLWSMERMQMTSGTALVWYVRRVFRIYPLAMFVVVAAVLLYLPSSPNRVPHEWPLTTILANLTLTQNLFYIDSIQGVLWSLPLEVQMYLALPVCYLLLRRLPDPLAPAMLLWVGAVIAGLLTSGIGRLNVLWFGPCFCAGILAYALTKKGIDRNLPSRFWIPILLGTTALLCAGIRSNYQRAWILALCVAIAVSCVRDARPTWMTNVASEIAKYSYGIYLAHFPCMWLGFKALASWPVLAQWAVAFGGTALTSVAAFHLIENPMIHLGLRASKHLQAHHPQLRGSSMA